jgi:helix-turn-helix protein
LARSPYAAHSLASRSVRREADALDGEVATCLLTTKQAAQYLCLEAQTLEVWRGRGKGPAFVKIGALVGHERRELDAFIERRSGGETRRTDR